MNATTTQQWTDDKPAEARMRYFGLKWEIETIDIKKIDQVSSWHNQARLGTPRIPELIDDYAIAMEQGAVFPRIVVFALPNGKYLVAGGNHRLAAAIKCGRKNIEVYLVQTDDSVVMDILPRTLNRDNGERTSREEALEGAVSAVMQKGMKTNDAANLFRISKSALGKAVIAKQMQIQLAEMAINAARVPKDVLHALHAFTDNENVLKVAANLAVDLKLTGEVIREVITTAKKMHKTEASRIAFIEEERKRLTLKDTKRNGTAHSHNGEDEAPPKPGFSQTEKTRFLMLITQLERRLAEKDSYEKNQITSIEEQEMLSKRLSVIAKKLIRMAKRGG